MAGTPSGVPSPFPSYCQLMLLYGDLSDIMNNVKGKWRQEPPLPSTQPGAAFDTPSLCLPRHKSSSLDSLQEPEAAIDCAYSALSPSMVWSTLNFQAHHAAGSGPGFLHLHLWHNSMLIMLHSAPLIYPRSRAAGMPLADRLAVVTHCCQQVCKVLEVADVSLAALLGCFARRDG